MKNIRPDFQIWEKEILELSPGYQKITCHMIFDVKMGKNFRARARFVADGHNTKTLESMTYSSVLSNKSVLISLTIATFNDLDILASSI